MGVAVSSYFPRLYAKNDIHILMVGLDNVGKTTLLYKAVLGEDITTISTIGYNVEKLIYKNINFLIWDVSAGRDCVRRVWHEYYEKCRAVIFVIDSTDRKGIEEAEWEIKRLFCRYETDNTILLVLGNKQDLPNAMTKEEIIYKLRLHELQNRKWHILLTSSKKGNCLEEAMDWLSNELAT